VGVIADDAQVESLAGIMGGDATAAERRHAQRLRRGGVLAARGRCRAARAASTSRTDAGHRLRARRRLRRCTVEHIERITQLIIEICVAASPGPMDDQVAELARAHSP
jgi:phenylalanyl-tRNA synthetase beta chain